MGIAMTTMISRAIRLAQEALRPVSRNHLVQEPSNPICGFAGLTIHIPGYRFHGRSTPLARVMQCRERREDLVTNRGSQFQPLSMFRAIQSNCPAIKEKDKVRPAREADNLAERGGFEPPLGY